MHPKGWLMHCGDMMETRTPRPKVARSLKVSVRLIPPQVGNRPRQWNRSRHLPPLKKPILLHLVHEGVPEPEKRSHGQPHAEEGQAWICPNLYVDKMAFFG
jgi:hypothetical protein